MTVLIFDNGKPDYIMSKHYLPTNKFLVFISVLFCEHINIVYNHHKCSQLTYGLQFYNGDMKQQYIKAYKKCFKK